MFGLDDWIAGLSDGASLLVVVLVATLLGAVLNDLCARRHLTPALVATGQDLKWLVRARIQDPDALPEESALTRGWRREHVLPDVLAVLEGRRGFRVGSLKSESPIVFIEVEPTANGPG